jgi:hypothetical protein
MLRGIETGKDVGLPEPYDSKIYPPQPGDCFPPPERKKRSTAVRAIVATAVVVIPIALVAFMYTMVIGTAPGCACIVTGAFGEVEVLNSTSVIVEFDKVSHDPPAMDLEISLMKDGVYEGWYSFRSHDEGALILRDGDNVGAIAYEDLADNRKVNRGDRLSITGLEPDAEYTIRLIWVPTGDLITTTNFATPL